MSLAVCTDPRFPTFGGGAGVSGEAGALSDRFRHLGSSLFNILSISRWKTSVGSELEEIYLESCVPDWDGYGGAPVSPLTLDAARNFILALPTDIPAPEITPQSDGEIAFEWHRDPSHTLSVSVGSDHRLALAGLFGSDEILGTVTFIEQMPLHIERLIRDLYSR